MIIYKCDNCGVELDQIDGRGYGSFELGNVCITVQGHIKTDLTGPAWINTSEDTDHHICRTCIIEVARKGEPKW